MKVDIIKSIHSHAGQFTAGTSVDIDKDLAGRLIRSGYAVENGDSPPAPVWDDPTKTPARKASQALWLACARLRGYTGPDDVDKAALIAEYGEPATK